MACRSNESWNIHGCSVTIIFYDMIAFLSPRFGIIEVSPILIYRIASV